MTIRVALRVAARLGARRTRPPLSVAAVAAGRPGDPLLVPRVFHQIWLGPKPLPDEFEEYGRTWDRHHPSWQRQVWTEDTLPEGLRPEVYEHLRAPAERSDIMRLELLHRFGGVYIDTDLECVRPIDALLGGLDFFCAYLKPGQVNNAFLGATARHPILERALSAVQPREWHGFDKAVAGPVFLNRMLAREDPASFTVFEPALFYPAGQTERARAYAIHHMARGWKTPDRHRDRALALERRLAEVRAELAQVEAETMQIRQRLGGRRLLPRR